VPTGLAGAGLMHLRPLDGTHIIHGSFSRSPPFLRNGETLWGNPQKERKKKEARKKKKTKAHTASVAHAVTPETVNESLAPTVSVSLTKSEDLCRLPGCWRVGMEMPGEARADEDRGGKKHGCSCSQEAGVPHSWAFQTFRPRPN
jgi:hypothetical protein